MVDLGVPEEGLYTKCQHSSSALSPTWTFARRCFGHLPADRILTYLITISPEEVLGSDVLVGVLCALLDGSLVGKVLPMLGP